MAISKVFINILILLFLVFGTNVFSNNKCPSNSKQFNKKTGWILYAKIGTKGAIRQVINENEKSNFRKKAAPLLGGFWAPRSMAAPTTATCAYHGWTEPNIKPVRYWLGKNILLPKTANPDNHYWAPDKEFHGQYICFISQSENRHECVFR